MLNDRERGMLARIEQDLIASDPRLARLFRALGQHVAHPPAPGSMRAAGPVPCLLLAAGLLLLMVGGAGALVPLAVIGIGLTLLALALAKAGMDPSAGFGLGFA